MFPLFIKPTGRGRWAFKEFVLEMDECGFWWTSGSSGVFRERSISLKDHALLFLASQIQKEHSINNTKVVTCSSQKHSGLVLDQQLNLTIIFKVKRLNVIRWLALLKDYQ